MDNGFSVHRATLEDLPTLKALWEVARLPVLDLERHLTEFQMATRHDGVVVGTIGFRIANRQALIHSEASYSGVQAGESRIALWGRLQVLARNQGVTRLWMKTPADSFWSGVGFKAARTEELAKLPAEFSGGHPDWFTFCLREEGLMPEHLEKQVEAFHAAAREQADRLRRQALAVKWLLGFIAIGFFAWALVLLLKALQARTRSRRRL